MIPKSILVRGARVHNLKNIDAEVPLNQIVGIAGVSGSGKSSLALGVLYAEGSRRYLESLSTYTRRRMTQAAKAVVDEVLYVPAALAMHQRPAVPGIRSTFGTGTELLNGLRLIFSRLASHRCPNGHYVPPTLNVAAEKEIVCPTCGVHFFAPGAEDLAFNSRGTCPKCSGTGLIRTVDESTLVPDENLTIEEGAVAPWNTLMWSLMVDVCRAMGVRTNVPFKDLSPKERDIVFHGPAVKKRIFYKAKNTNSAGELDFTYFNAVYTVENALTKVKDEKGMKRVEKFLKESVCPACGGNRLSDLGVGYLQLDRASSTLSTGERQRMQLARAVRNRTTGVLYVLDEPSIGLHPANLEGLIGVMHDLLADGNSIVLVDHDVQVLREAGWLIEMGPGAGAKGGTLLAQGTVASIESNAASRIGPYLAGRAAPARTSRAAKDEMFAFGRIHLSTLAIHTVKPLEVDFPKGRLTVVTGVSGSGKSTLVLESLVPALQAAAAGRALPAHVRAAEAPGITRAQLIDASPIGTNIRSTAATYADVHDELRKVFARTADARAGGWKSGDFSYNTGRLRCPACDGTGVVSLDVQFLPDVDIPCPDCRGSRYAKEAQLIKRTNKAGRTYSLPELMDMDVDEALQACADLKTVASRLKTLADLGLGYLTLGEGTPGLSGGEAQRLKLASEMGRGQSDALFVFDEPTIGLHPADVAVLLKVFEQLLASGATVIVIEHDLDVIRSADWIVDLGPGGGDAGGELVVQGTPEDVKAEAQSITGQYI